MENTPQDVLTVQINSYDNNNKNSLNNGTIHKEKKSKFDLLKEEYSGILRIGLKAVFYLLLLGHFIWATVYFIRNSDDPFENTTCSGYGFLVIIYSLAILGITYSKIIKKPFRRHIWRPISNITSKIKYGDIIFYLAFLIGSLSYLIWDSREKWDRLIPISGIIIFIALGYVFSKHRHAIPWRTVIWGIILQFSMGLLVIRWDTGRNIFQCIGDKVTVFLGYAQYGAAFVYGDTLIYELKVFAFQALCTIFFLSFIVNVLYHYGIMQNVVLVIGTFLQWVMGTTICESVNTAANIFLGQSEAPLLLKPYLQDLTTSEVHTLLTSGFATVSGTVLAAYISFGASATDLITASVMSAPAALCYSKLLYPEIEEVKSTKKTVKLVKSEYESAVDAGAKGAWDAIQLVQGIIASVLAFVSIIYFASGMLSFMGEQVGYTGDEAWTVELVMGKVFIPVSYIMGVPWEECERVGYLVGIKTMINEFVAFSEMQKTELTPRTKMITTYALCGFSNPCSIGIMISALGVLIPSKREAVTRIVFRAFVAGSVVCLMTACFAGLVYPNDLIGT